MKIVIENADENDFNELAQLARIGRIHTFYLTDEDEGLQGEWIPVGERLPERYKEVIVTDIETEGTYCSWYYGNGYWECDNGVHKNRIIAWQPLPEPYKKDGVK